jgi:hypothetical protein
MCFVHFGFVHFGFVHFGFVHFGFVHFGFVHFGFVHFGFVHFAPHTPLARHEFERVRRPSRSAVWESPPSSVRGSGSPYRTSLHLPHWKNMRRLMFLAASQDAIKSRQSGPSRDAVRLCHGPGTGFAAHDGAWWWHVAARLAIGGAIRAISIRAIQVVLGA